MQKIEEALTGDIKRIGVAGHVNPDGDCTGSTTALYLYLKKNLPNTQVDLYLELPKDSLARIDGVSDAKQTIEQDVVYDLFITTDVSDINRIGIARELFDAAKQTICIDHHISNPGFADINCIVPHASSACEVLADLLDYEKLDQTIAKNLYTGMVTDSGVFQFSNTSPHTMRVAASLMEFGFDHSKLIDSVFNQRTYKENRILGYALQKAKQECDGAVITCFITLEEMARFAVEKKNLDMIVSQLRLTEGAEAAVFIYETLPGEFKASLRSNEYLNVADVASVFGGGGHAKAAGCTLKGTPEEVISKILPAIKERLR